LGVPQITVAGRLAPVDWPALEAFARLLREFASVRVTPGKVISASMEAGTIRLAWAGDAAEVRLAARDPSAAQNLRDTLGHLLDSTATGLAAGLSWPDAGEGSLPPNFRLARVAGVSTLSPNFLRLRLEAEDIFFMARTGLHLRLLQPCDPGNPVWPRLSVTGRTVWPGPGLLHMPAYTIRAIDPVAGWLDLDIYLHGNGPTCACARAARPGDRIGISGPGGGWLPQAGRLALGGDETALPVIARILAEAASDTLGHAVIALQNPADRQEIDAPAGVTVEWLGPGEHGRLAARFEVAAAEALSAPVPAQVLFGGERRDAEGLRRRLRARFPSAGRQLSVAGYWDASAKA